LAGLSITSGYEAFPRRSQFAFSTNTGSPVFTNTYACDAASSLSSGSLGTYSAAYGYLVNSPVVSQITFKQNLTVRMTTETCYILSRLQSLSSASATTRGSAYECDKANQRPDSIPVLSMVAPPASTVVLGAKASVGIRLLLILQVCVALTGCVEKSGSPVRIVVPGEFRGLVRIVEDKSGVEVPFENGELIFRIPTNGVLTVKETVGFGEWHQEQANFSNGEPLPILPRTAPEPGPGKAALYGLGRSQKQLRFFVGTQGQMIDFLKSPSGVPR